MRWPWNVLGLDGPAPLSEIRRAYAGCLKITHPEEHPEQFQRLHTAYQAACRLARNNGSHAPDLPYEYPAPKIRSKDGRGDDHLFQRGHGFPPKVEQNDEQPAWKYDQLFQKQRQPQVEAGQEKVEQNDRDHEQLRLTGEELSQRNEQQKAYEQDWDYGQLLQGETSPQTEARQEEVEQDWDFNQLCQTAGEPLQKSEHQKAYEQDWDYDRLMQGETSPQAEVRQERVEQDWDWDYDQLFQLAQTEENELRLRLRDTLRERNRWRYKFWSKRDRLSPLTEQERWGQVSMALDVLEQAFNVNAALNVWKQFFSSELFLQVKKEPDFVFGLEWLLESHPELPPEVCGVIYRAYGFMNRKQKDRVSVFGSFRPLFKLLLKYVEVKQKKRGIVSSIGYTWLVLYILFKVIRALRVFMQI